MTDLLGDGWDFLPGLPMKEVIQSTFSDDYAEEQIVSNDLAGATIHVAYCGDDPSYVLYEKNGQLYEVLDYPGDCVNRVSPVWDPEEITWYELSINASDWFHEPYGRIVAHLIWAHEDAP